jgi:alcohol dehydrogenase class IV
LLKWFECAVRVAVSYSRTWTANSLLTIRLTRNLTRSYRVLESLRATGFNPYVGRALYHHAYMAGLSNLKVQVEGYHVIAGNISAELRTQWALKIAIARPAIVAALSDRSEAFIDRLLSYLDRPDTFTFSQQITVVGQRA